MVRRIFKKLKEIKSAPPSPNPFLHKKRGGRGAAPMMQKLKLMMGGVFIFVLCQGQTFSQDMQGQPSFPTSQDIIQGQSLPPINLSFKDVGATGSLPSKGPTLHLTMREAILLALRYNQNVQSAELQRILDKFSLAVAQNQFETHYSLVGSLTNSQSMSDAQPWTTSRTISVTPSLSQQTRFGTKFGVALKNPLAFTTAQGGYVFNPALAFTISQPLLRGSGQLITEAPLMNAYNTEEINKLNYKNAVISVVTAIITTYRAVVANENALIVDKEALKSAQKTVAQNKIRIANGFMAPSENVQAEFAVAQQELLVATDINNIIQAKLALLQAIGLSPSTKIEVDKTIVTEGVTYPKGEEAKRILFCNNINYLTNLITMRNKKLSVFQAEDQQRWQLNFNVELDQGPGSGPGPNAGYKSLFNGRNVNRAIALDLAIPIDDLSTQQSLVSAKVGYDQSKLLLKQLRMSLESQLEGTLENLEIAKTQIILAKRSQDLANLSYQNSLIQLKYGKVSLFEVTTLQSSLVTAQIAYITTQINYLNLVTAYQQNLGITLDVWNIQLKY